MGFLNLWVLLGAFVVLSGALRRSGADDDASSLTMNTPSPRRR
jgi:hypothetical protein